MQDDGGAMTDNIGRCFQERGDVSVTLRWCGSLRCMDSYVLDHMDSATYPFQNLLKGDLQRRASWRKNVKLITVAQVFG